VKIVRLRFLNGNEQLV